MHRICRVATSLLSLVGAVSACHPLGEEVPLRNLKNRAMSVYIRRLPTSHLQESAPVYEVQVGVLYDQTGDGCLYIPSDSKATLNNNRIQMVHNGSTGRGGACSAPRFEQRFSELPTGDATVVVSDGDLSMRMVVKGFLDDPTLAMKNGHLVQGDYNAWLDLTPANYIHYDAGVAFYANATDEDLGTTAFLRGGGNSETAEQDIHGVDEGRVGFSVPGTAPVGSGMLRFRSMMEATVFGVCEHASECGATRFIDVGQKVDIVPPDLNHLYQGIVGDEIGAACPLPVCIEFEFYGGGTTMDVRQAPSNKTHAFTDTRVATRWEIGGTQPYTVWIPFDFTTMQATASEIEYTVKLQIDNCGNADVMMFSKPGSEVRISAAGVTPC